MFTERRARSREAEISLEISANVTSSKSRSLGLKGIALALFTRVLELFFITFNVSAARNVVTQGKQFSCRPLPAFGRGRNLISRSGPLFNCLSRHTKWPRRVRKGLETLTGEVLGERQTGYCDEPTRYRWPERRDLTRSTAEEALNMVRIKCRACQVSLNPHVLEPYDLSKCSSHRLVRPGGI